MNHAEATLKLKRIVAITSLDNDASIKLLQRIGFAFEDVIHLSNDPEQVKLFGKNLGSTR